MCILLYSGTYNKVSKIRLLSRKLNNVVYSDLVPRWMVEISITGVHFREGRDWCGVADMLDEHFRETNNEGVQSGEGNRKGRRKKLYP